MPRHNVDFTSVSISCDGCGATPPVLDRHHLKHEKLFIEGFKGTATAKTKWYRSLRARYYEFRPYDIRRICRRCHQDVHKAYHQSLYGWFIRNKASHISYLSIKEADAVMTLMRKRYFKWRKRRRKGK